MADPTDRQVSVIRNISGSTIRIGYVRGTVVELAAGADVQVDGDIYVLLSMKPYDKRKLTALRADETAGRVKVIQTPSAVLRDTSTGRVYEQIVTAGTYTAANSAAGSYSGPAPLQ